MKHSGISSFSVILTFVSLSILAIGFIPILNIQFEATQTASKSMIVNFQWQGVSANVIEQEATSKLEGVFSELSHLTHISSNSANGSGTIELAFDKKTKMDTKRFEVASLIRRIYENLPEGVSYPIVSAGQTMKASNIPPILTYSFNGNASPFYLREFVLENINPVVGDIKGVHQISVSDAPPYEWEIEYKADVLTSLHISVSEVTSAIRSYFNEQFSGRGSYVVPGSSDVNEIAIKIVGNSSDSLEWSHIPIKNVNGRVVFLGDLANTHYRERQPSSYTRINGLNTIVIQVIPEENTNTIELAKEVRAKVELLKATFPPGYMMLLTTDATVSLSREFERNMWRTVFSLCMLLIFVWITSRELRYLFLILISMVMNLLIACIFYYFMDVQIHLISLAGITISFGMIIDNSIVMIDHMRISKNKNVFLAIIGATLTTVASMCIIFLLQAEQQASLIDLAKITIINLSISLLIAYYLIPALMDKIHMTGNKKRLSKRRSRLILGFTRFYSKSIVFSKRYGWVYAIVLILGFGIPIHMMPQKIEIKPEEKSYWGEKYNKVFDKEWFRKTKPVLEKIVGGSFRLFSQNVFSGGFYGASDDQGHTKIRISANMPEGCSVYQMNETISQMENIISKYKEVALYKTQVYSSKPPSALIEITFLPEFEYGGFPYYLKDELEVKAIDFGGASWSISGVGDGFYNGTGVYDSYRNANITLQGYNYDQLYSYAQMLGKSLEESGMGRIRDVEIVGSPNSQYSSTRIFREFYLNVDDEKMAMGNISPQQFFSQLNQLAYRQPIGNYYFNDKAQRVFLTSDQYDNVNLWDVKNTALVFGQRSSKLNELGTIEKKRTGNEIYKYNQQYQLGVSYTFVGTGSLESAIKKRNIDNMRDKLPLGFSVAERIYGWNPAEQTQYYYLMLIILVIYFICAILFESLRQPLAIISLIPVPFIGVFLTFYLFGVNFDQGGFAAFVLLTGLVVNAGVFIINDYNNLRREHPNVNPFKQYVRAFNHKIIPIALTILSTVVGLIPFIYNGKGDRFWYPFAMGTIGGLLFSFLAVIMYLPLFMVRKKNMPVRKKIQS